MEFHIAASSINVHNSSNPHRHLRTEGEVGRLRLRSYIKSRTNSGIKTNLSWKVMAVRNNIFLRKSVNLHHIARHNNPEYGDPYNYQNETSNDTHHFVFLSFA